MFIGLYEKIIIKIQVVLELYSFLLPGNRQMEKKLARPNKKLRVLRVMGLNILGRAGTHFFLIIFIFWKKYNVAHFERHLP